MSTPESLFTGGTCIRRQDQECAMIMETDNWLLLD